MKLLLVSALAFASFVSPAPNAVRGVAEAVASHPPLRAGAAYEDLADAIGAKKRGVAEAVATRPPLRAGSAYEDLADAVNAKREPHFEVVKVFQAAKKQA